ncbi:DsrE family protein [Haloplasma contractile]|uniref:tRNA 2-thiouridine synthesizing protein A n=1 Tax=Haloplasma contractile SSD-17B TaxID=1033810 RepID=U2EEU5_9MOLU|nr:DsrE family protein [Haloplasma contractile]ERJ13216.1 tRNA 2-thiouridine synthesizing protein A [Haloplasma contractile SSD-17B]
MKNKVILVSSDQLGAGDKELGETILETFFTLLKQREEKPVAIFCMNRGVLTMTDESLISVHLRELADQGVPVLACKTCVEYYKIQDQLTSGELSSMNKFIELASKYDILTIS